MRMSGKATVATLLALTATLGASPIASAQEDGVTIDPGSPAAKEYALPHEEARRESGDKPDAPVKQGSRDSELFGEGVKPDASSTSTGSTSGADTTAAKKKAAAEKRAKKRAAAKKKRAAEKKAKEEAAAASTPEATPAASTPDNNQVVAAATDDDSSGGGSGLIIGGAAALLLVAVLGGFGLRAVRGPSNA